MNSTQLLNSIDHIEAVAVAVGSQTKYRIDAVLESGEKIVLKKTSNKIPKAVQLYNKYVNAVAKHGTEACYFGFTAKPDSWHTKWKQEYKHLKSYQVIEA